MLLQHNLYELPGLLRGGIWSPLVNINLASTLVYCCSWHIFCIHFKALLVLRAWINILLHWVEIVYTCVKQVLSALTK